SSSVTRAPAVPLTATAMSLTSMLSLHDALPISVVHRLPQERLGLLLAEQVVDVPGAVRQNHAVHLGLVVHRLEQGVVGFFRRAADEAGAAHHCARGVARARRGPWRRRAHLSGTR